MNFTLKEKIIYLSNLSLVETKLFEKNNLIFITSCGIIEGQLTTKEEFESLENNPNLFPITTVNTVIEKINTYSENISINASEYLFLKNVTLLNGQQKINIPCIILFTNDIIGFSVGNL